MSKWKMVPMELTPAMVDAIDTGRTDSAGSIYYNLLAAAPEWEPSDEDMTNAMAAWIRSYRARDPADVSLRAEVARLTAALNGKENSDA